VFLFSIALYLSLHFPQLFASVPSCPPPNPPLILARLFVYQHAAYSCTLLMEAGSSCQMLAHSYQTVWSHIAEDLAAGCPSHLK
jgi:hypothetical protein